MNAFLTSAIHSETAIRGLRKTVAEWIRQRFEERRRRQRDREAIAHLRKLEPYLLQDAGIDEAPLHAALARIMALHPGYALPR